MESGISFLKARKDLKKKERKKIGHALNALNNY